MIEIKTKVQNRYFSILIKDNEVFYVDGAWKGPIRWFPSDPTAPAIIRASRNRIPMMVIDLLKLTPEESAEYEANKNDEEKLREICCNDIKKKGYDVLEVKRYPDQMKQDIKQDQIKNEGMNDGNRNS